MPSVRNAGATRVLPLAIGLLVERDQGYGGCSALMVRPVNRVSGGCRNENRGWAAVCDRNLASTRFWMTTRWY